MKTYTGSVVILLVRRSKISDLISILNKVSLYCHYLYRNNYQRKETLGPGFFNFWAGVNKRGYFIMGITVTDCHFDLYKHIPFPNYQIKTRRILGIK